MISFAPVWVFGLFVSLTFFCHSLATPYPSPLPSLSLISNGSANPATFEDNVGHRLQQLRSTWRGIAPWAIYVRSSNGRPVLRIEQFQEITIATYDRQHNLLIISENKISNPSDWNAPVVQPATAAMAISTWNWDQPRINLVGAWAILRHTTEVPIIQIILIQYLDGPEWGPDNQQYYVFYPDRSADHVLCIGASDGLFYRPAGPLPSPLNWAGADADDVATA